MNTRDIGSTLNVGAVRKAPCEIVESLRNDLLIRSELGLAKYGMTLSDNPAGIIERLTHIEEELLDATLYIRWTKKLLREMEMGQHDYAQFVKDIDQVANGHVERINSPANYTIFADNGTVYFTDIRNKQDPKAIGSVRG